MRLLILIGLLAGCLTCIGPRTIFAQPYGVSSGNNLMPASGGMGGTSVARPQDFLSAVNFNPAALTQYEGTQFTLAGTWAEPTFNINQTASLPGIGVTPFSAKSSTPGILAPNIGMFQQVEVNGRDLHVGLALLSASGLGTNFLHMPQSGGTSSYLLCLELAPSVGFQLTDELAVGAGIFLGTAFLEGPYVARSAMTNDYALRANVGLDYDVSEETNLGFYWKTRQNFTFHNQEVLTPGTAGNDIHLGLPEQFGIGLANSSLAEGRLLLAADVLYLMWDTADFWKNQYRNQWILQLGMQYEVNDRFKIRAGYDYAENPVDDNVGTTGTAANNNIAKYTQAQFGVINENRFTFGAGVVDVLPGLDFDFFAGGMPRVSHNFGSFTSVNLESYWIGAGLTWRFGDMYYIERR
jgi:long-chain fatty acid transport protein